MLDSPRREIGDIRLPELTFYTTEGCHLCEEAEQLMNSLRDSGIALSWHVVDIASDDTLFERYGWSIPVLRLGGGRELKWPFDAAALAEFIAQAPLQ
jgi:hypothetical protein